MKSFILSALRQITAVRFVGTMVLVFALLGASYHFGIIPTLWDTGIAINNAAYVFLHDGSYSQYLATEFGRTATTFYGAVGMLVLACVFCPRMRHLDRSRYAFVGILIVGSLFMMAAVVYGIVFAKPETWTMGSSFFSLAPNWSLNLLSFFEILVVPPATIALFGYVTILFWRGTKPQAAHGPDADSDTASALGPGTDACTAKRTDGDAKNGGGLHVLQLHPFRRAAAG